MSRRWTSGHLVVAVEVACGLVVAGYFTHLGVTAEVEGLPGRSGVDRALPFVLAAAALLVLAVLTPRRWRRAGSEPPPPPRPRPRARPDPDVPIDVPTGSLVEPTGSLAGPHRRPSLSEAGRRELERVVAVLADAGLLAPLVPDPTTLVEAVADHGEPVTAEAVFAAVAEAGYWHPGFRADDYLAAVVFEHWRVEQPADTLREQVADLDRLLGDDLTVGLADLRLTPEGGAVRTRLTLVLDGRPEHLDYLGAVKALSTVVYVTVARALVGTPARLAWLPGDQGVQIAVLRGAVTVERLNADLGAAVPDAWEWVDEQEPLVAGEL